MSSESWPPSLKDWVAKCLGQMTDANRAEAQAELKQVISEAFSNKTLWTTDWAGVQLQSLLPKQSFINPLKRKLDVPSPNNKKTKKTIHTTPVSDPFNDQIALDRRAARFRREHDLEMQKSRMGSSYSTGSIALKANNSNSHLFSTSRSASPLMAVDDPEVDANVMDWDRFTIVGTSKELFKDYLRLTSEPRPETIRPYPVLQQTLEQLKGRWKAKVASYSWICNQFKSLRQDLTVQRIKNTFTVEVYEIHARIALENSDMVEYNQCQATLKSLYELGIPGKVEEFTAYRILMLLHGRNWTELNLFVGQLTTEQKRNPAVQHALDVQRAMSMGNYHSLFILYDEAPNMSGYIMDHFVDRERARALMIITRAYKRISLTFLAKELAFESSTEQAKEYLITHGVAFFLNPNSPDSEKSLDCKAAATQLATVYEQKYRRVGIRGAI